jgi:hypothetical protein
LQDENGLQPEGTSVGINPEPMKRAALIGAVAVTALAILAGIVLMGRGMALRTAKAHAIVEFSTNKEFLNMVPAQRSIPRATDYTNELLVYTDGQILAFPTDRFSHDSKPKRRNVYVHHSRYRILMLPGTGKDTWGSIMQDLNHTDLYRFFQTVLSTTEHAITEEPDMDSLEKHMLFLTAKKMMVPGNGEFSMIEFKREDLKGFIFGDPAKTDHLYVSIFVEKAQRFVELGIIQEKPLQMSDVDELISVLKIRPNVALEVTNTPALSHLESITAQAAR